MTFLKTLSFREFGSPTAPKSAYLLHGLLGNGRNWTTFLRKLVELRPDYRFIVPDIRNHGESVGFPGPQTVEACAEDLHRLAQTTGIWPSAMIGHSLGGKIILNLASQTELMKDFADRNNNHVSIAVLDSYLGLSSDAEVAISMKDPNSPAAILDLARKAPMPVSRRGEVQTLFNNAGTAPAISMWMASNLREIKGPADASGVNNIQYEWLFDAEKCYELFCNYNKTDAWPVVLNPPNFVSIDLVMATMGRRWDIPEVKRNLKQLDDIQRERSRRVGAVPSSADDASSRSLPPFDSQVGLVRPISVEGGHWLHVDNPRRVMEVLDKYTLL